MKTEDRLNLVLTEASERGTAGLQLQKNGASRNALMRTRLSRSYSKPLLLVVALMSLCFSPVGFALPGSDLFANSPLRDVIQHAENIKNNTQERGEDNKVLILDHGYDALLVRIHLIRNATESIQVQTFIWRNDESGRLVMKELIAAAERGVKVRMIIDQIASEKDAEMIAFLSTAHPNFKLKYYNPIANKVNPLLIEKAFSFLTSFRRTNQRMHNKILTIDNVVGISGGRNIENKYFDYSTEFNFKDRDILLIGPVVQSMDDSFEAYWNDKRSVDSLDLRDVARAARRSLNEISQEVFEFGDFFETLELDLASSESIRNKFIVPLMVADYVQFIADQPGKNDKKNLGFYSGKGELTESIENTILNTEEKLLIQTPYLVLSGYARNLLRDLRDQHPELEIKISTNSFASTDNIMAYSANYKLRATYVEDLKFDIREYIPYPADIEQVNGNQQWLVNRLEQQYGTINTEVPVASSEREKLTQFLREIFLPSEILDTVAHLLHIRKDDPKVPFICIHSKSFVSDDRVAFIGSYNLDPRSGNINTEVGVFIYDERVAKALSEEIERDMAPGNSWRIARQAHALEGLKNNPLQTLNYVMDKFSSSMSILSPIDLWPFHYTSAFELIPGKEELPLEDPDFYSHYRDIGSFPGYADNFGKELLTGVYRVFGGIASPLL